jgi:enoyl-CoA hydratase/carnithine racemase
MLGNESGNPWNNRYARDFFEREYRLDYQIHTYPKPVVCWGHGIVMGGGVGLMLEASHRVASDTLRLAMPEIFIGLFPDVGGGGKLVSEQDVGQLRFIPGADGCSFTRWMRLRRAWRIFTCTMPIGPHF